MKNSNSFKKMSDSESESSDASDDIFNDYVTLGKSTEFEPIVWLFPDTDQCPLKDCMLSCSSRSVCLGHFHLVHADKTMLCAICNELILAKNPMNLFRHHQDHHPKEPPPKLKSVGKINGGSTKMAKPHQNDDEDEDENQEDENGDKMDQNDKEDDAIIMTGCGHISQWIWPKNLTKCPVQHCNANVRNRREAMDHFRATHSHVSLLCPLCDLPIYAPYPSKFQRHHDRKHPNMTMPFDFKAIVNKPKKSTSEIKKEVYDDKSDLVKLKYGKWWFPDTTECPVVNCKLRFGSRCKALKHYKQQHAMHSIYCHLCNKPIRIDVHKNGFIAHFQTIHPKQKIPYGLGNQLTDAKCHTEKVEQSDHDGSGSDDDVSNEADDLIVLSGCGLKFPWKFPQSTKCISCYEQFGVRSDAIAHFKRKHADRSTLCPVCKKPVLMRTVGDIRCHYNRVHPHSKLPSYFVKLSRKNKKKNLKIEKSDHHDESDEDVSEEVDNDDVIVLCGLGLKSKWKFPKTTRCPVHNCKGDFDKRSDVIAHFKRKHANACVLCPICNSFKVIRKPCDIRYHYNRVHPNEEMPSYFRKSQEIGHRSKSCSEPMKIENSDQYDESDDAASNKVNDLIVLSGLGLKSMWQFPHRTRCPVKNCREQFSKRVEAIVHYKKKHAKRSILCPICNYPVQMRSYGDIAGHYRKRHPNKDLPPHFVNPVQQFNTKSQTKRARSNSSSGIESQPPKEMHKKSRLSCPLKTCSYETMQMTDLCTHWTQDHGELEFPDYRIKNDFNYVADTPKPVIHRKVNIVLGKSNVTNGSGTVKSYTTQKSDLGNGWFTLTSDEDDDDDDKSGAAEVQNDKKCGKPNLNMPKLLDSSQDDSDTDCGGDDTSSRRDTRGKRIKYSSDHDSCSD